MERTSKSRRVDAGFIVDLIQAVVAIIAAIALALDTTGLLDLPWIQGKLGELTFIAVCILIVASALERRFTLQSYKYTIDAGFENTNKQLQSLRDNMSGVVSADLLLRDRSDYNLPLEIRLQNAKEVCISGRSLIGFVTHYKSLFLKYARQGCKFRFLVNDPLNRDRDGKEIEQALTYLTEIQKQVTSQIEIYLSSATLSCSILMIDAQKDTGDIQVEFYIYQASESERPHINLSPRRDPKWYEFYRIQFETLWSNGRPYQEQASTQETTPKGETV
jgi:hypothetical protein